MASLAGMFVAKAVCFRKLPAVGQERAAELAEHTFQETTRFVSPVIRLPWRSARHG